MVVYDDKEGWFFEPAIHKFMVKKVVWFQT